MQKNQTEPGSGANLASDIPQGKIKAVATLFDIRYTLVEHPGFEGLDNKMLVLASNTKSINGRNVC